MTKIGWVLCVISVLILVAAVILFVLPAKTIAPGLESPPTIPPAAVVPQIPDIIVVDSIQQGSTISSPITITGRARGPWYFEASFPVEIKNATGTIIAQGPAQAQGSWQTTDFVPFSITLTFPAQVAGSPGFVVLKKDNPSGDPARDQSLIVPIVFQ